MKIKGALEDAVIASNDANLLADDVMLLALDESAGDFPSDRAMDAVLSLALLFDLAIMNRITVWGEDNRLFVEDASTTQNDQLDAALAILRKQDGSIIADAVTAVAQGARERMLQHLVSIGILREPERGVFGTLKYQAVNRARIRTLRDTVRDALEHNHTPDERIAQLIALMYTTDFLDQALVLSAQDDADESFDKPIEFLSDEINARAEQITEQTWLALPTAATIVQGGGFAASGFSDSLPI